MTTSVQKKIRHAITRPFVRGVATFQAGNIVMICVSFVTSIVYARLLGAEGFGLYAVALAFAGIISIFSSYGQESATATFLAEAVGKKNDGDIGRALRYFLQASLLSMTVMAMLSVCAISLAVRLGYDAEVGTLGRLALVNAALQWPNVLLFLALQMEQRYGSIAVIENTIDILQFLLSLGLLLLGWSVQGILWGTLIVSAAAVPFCLWMYQQSAKRQGFPSLSSLVGGLLKYNTVDYVRQGLWIALDRNISGNIYPNIFYIILGATASLQVVGLFRVAFRLATLPLSFVLPSITRMTAVAIPKIAVQDRSRLIRSCRNVLLGSAGISLAAVAGSALIAPPLIPLVYGTEYSAAIPLFLLLLPLNIVASFHVISVPLLRVYRRVWVIIIINALGVLLGIGCYVVALQWISPLMAIGLGILVFHLNSLWLFVYLWVLLRSRRSLPAIS